MDKINGTIRSMDIPLAFRDNDFRHNGIGGKDGTLFFFYHDQVIEILPLRYQLEKSNPQIVISHFSVFDKERHLTDMHQTQVLSHKENFFSFGFSAIKTHPNQKMYYAYRIKGFDKDWIYTERPFANYTNVPFGHYTFQVKAAHEKELFGEPLINLPLTINPPFWRTWWFILIASFAVMGIILAIHRYRISQIKKVMTLRARISRDLHDEVGSALSSIHVYSSVAAKAMDKNPIATRDALQVIHDNSRQVMENMGDIVWAINSGESNEISLEKKLKNYGFELLTPLDIVVTYVISTDAEQKLTHMEARKNILLIAKETMNNIARYSKATTASIALSLNAQQLQLRISDNGIGFDTANHKAGNGLWNIRSRCESLGGKCDIQSQPGKGTDITCIIPLTSIREN